MMRSALIHIALTTLCMAAAVQTAVAQQYDAAVRRNPWNEGVNRAGLREDSISMSYAEVQFLKADGGMTDHSVSDDSWRAGVVTESMRHFGKISFAGRFAYDYQDGRNMCGSMFIHPGIYPVDIYEFTPGRKILENYAFTGGLSADLGREWRGGLHVDFAADNYAKRKDLRHKNTRLDFEAAPSVQWHRGGWRLGAAYIFSKNSERIEADEIGSTPDSYEAFFDKGLFYGERALWDSNSIHLDENGIDAFPIHETTHGAAVQLQWRMLYGEAEYRRSAGETGEKGVTWHSFGGDAVRGKIAASFGSAGGSMHFIRAYAEWSRRDNAESILVRETTGGVTNTEILGSVPIYAERQMALRLEYEWMRAGSGVRAGADWNRRMCQSSLAYPQLREQQSGWWNLWVDGRWASRHVELSAGAWVRRGSLDESERTTTTAAASQTAYPSRLTEYAAWNAEYLTALRAGAKLGVRVNIVRGIYCEVSARYEHGFRLTAVPQPNRVEYMAAVGWRW